MVVRNIFSSILQIWYVEVGISWSVSESPLEFEIMRVNCTLWSEWHSSWKASQWSYTVLIITDMWQRTLRRVFGDKSRIIFSNSQWNRMLKYSFAEALLMRTHSICFHGEIRKTRNVFVKHYASKEAICMSIQNAKVGKGHSSDKIDLIIFKS